MRQASSGPLLSEFAPRPVPATRSRSTPRNLSIGFFSRPSSSLLLLPLLGLGLALLAPPPAVAGYGTATFPCPPELTPRVGFWVRIFTEFSENQRVIHDARFPWVIYEVLDVKGLSQRQITALTNSRKEHYQRLLAHLAVTPPQQYSEEDRRVARLLSSVPEMARFTLAEERVRSQAGIKEQFRVGLQRSGRYIHAMEAIFDSLNVPREILCLPHVESSFYAHARSKAGAAGLWQFTARTGKLFLRIERDLDERLDPLSATAAAAHFLLHSYDCLGSWPLAVMAYNHGLGGMMQAKAKFGSEDVARILLEYDGPSYGFASQNFYCEFLAAVDVTGAAEKYFGPFEPDPPLVVDDFRLPEYVKFSTLAKAFGVTTTELAQCNPALGRSFIRGSRLVPRGYVVHLPMGHAPSPPVQYASIPPSERYTKVPPVEGYKVRPGDTLAKIARSHKVSVEGLRKLNGLGREARIFPGQVLVFPDRTGRDGEL